MYYLAHLPYIILGAILRNYHDHVTGYVAFHSQHVVFHTTQSERSFAHIRRPGLLLLSTFTVFSVQPIRRKAIVLAASEPHPKYFESVGWVC